MASYFIINNELESNILFIYTLSSYKHAQIHDHGSVYECALSNTHRAYVGMTTEVFTSVPWAKHSTGKVYITIAKVKLLVRLERA